MEYFRGKVEKWKSTSIQKSELFGQMKKVFINCDFGLGAELPARANEKYSCVMGSSKGVPVGPKARTKGSRECDTTGKAARRSRDESGSTDLR